MNKLYEENDIKAMADAIRTKQPPISKNFFDIGTTEDYFGEGSPASIDGNTMQIKIVGVGRTYNFNTKNKYKSGTYYLSAKSSINNGRFYIRLRNQNDTDWLSNREAFVGNWEYNEFYRGWFVNLSGSTTLGMKVIIPDCLYWEMGVGFESINEYIGTTQTLSRIQIEEGTQATEYEPYIRNTFKVRQMAEAIRNISRDAVLDITNDDRLKIVGNTLEINNTEIQLVEVFNDGAIAEGYSIKQTASAGVAPSVNIGNRIAVSGTSDSSSGSEGQLYIDKAIDFSKVEKMEIYGSGSTSASNKGNNGGIFRIVTDYSKVTNLSDSYAVQLGCTSNMFTDGKITFTQSIWEGVKNAYIVIRSRVDYGRYNYNYSISKIVIYIRENI